MDLQRFKIGYIPGHTPQDNQDVIIACFIHPDSIMESNEDIMICSGIECVIHIMDKKMNEYSIGVNSFDPNPIVFHKSRSILFETPFRLYRSIKCAKKIHKFHKLYKLTEYNDKGQIQMKGTIYNGLFSGQIFNKENVLNIRDGKIN